MTHVSRVEPAQPEPSRNATARRVTAESHCHAMLVAAYEISQTDDKLFTDEALAERAGLRVQGICWWHRASDLRAAGLIRLALRNGKPYKVKGSNGRLVRVSGITDEGIRYITQQTP